MKDLDRRIVHELARQNSLKLHGVYMALGQLTSLDISEKISFAIKETLNNTIEAFDRIMILSREGENNEVHQ